MVGNAVWVIGNAASNVRHTRSIGREYRIHVRNTRTHDVYMPANDRERLIHYREHLIHDRERTEHVRSRSIYDPEGLLAVWFGEKFDQRAVIEQVRDAECRRNQGDASRQDNFAMRIVGCDHRKP